MMQYFLNGNELNPDEEVAFGAAIQPATSGKGFSQVQETIEIVSLFDGVAFLFEELNTDYYRNSTDPIEKDEMMGYAEMIKISA